MLKSIFKKYDAPMAREGGEAQSLTLAPTSEQDSLDDEADGLGSLPGCSSSTSMVPPRLTAQRRHTQRAEHVHEDSDFEPLSAQDCFENAIEIEVQGHGTWRVYITPPRPPRRSPPIEALRSPTPLIATVSKTLATGRGDAQLSALRPPLIGDDDDENDEQEEGNRKGGKSNPGTMIFFHHGAGFSALSFALTAREITRLTSGEVGVMALDCRGHGRTTHPANVSLPLDMSPARLTHDCVSVLTKLYPDVATMPSFVLVGHSMGGSVVVSLANALQSLRPVPARVAGVAVLDVVEGTATEALPGMKHTVERLPVGFNSVQEAIRWHVESGQIHNLNSARRSVPPLLVPNASYRPSVTSPTPAEIEELAEELQEVSSDVDTSKMASSDESKTRWPLVWRHDLLSTSPFWPSWFKGLSASFLAVKAARLLVLAGTDRLDKDLMVGHMQGKYQLHVLQDVGHCLHEDVPDKTASLLVDFWRRNEVVPAKLARLGVGLRKVGQ